MKFVIATHNKHKLQELQRILSPLGIDAVTADLSEVEETGTTFAENAYLKAKAACEETGLPAVADDSGLEVDALDGRPGVYSARYAGEGATDAQRIEKLLGELAEVPAEKRGHGLSVLSAVCSPMETRSVRKGIVPVPFPLHPPEKTALAMIRCFSAAKRPLLR